MPNEFSRLRQLANVVERFFPKRSSIVSSTSQDASAKIFEGLLDPAITKEDSLIEFVMPEAKKRSGYHVARNQLKEKLFNTLFLLDLSSGDSSAYRKAIYANAKTVFLTRILSLFGLHSLAVQQSKSGLKEARSFELTPNAIHFLIIMGDWATQNGQKELQDRLTKERQESLALYMCELEAHELWNQLAVDLAITGTASKQITAKAVESCRRLEQIFAKHRTFNIGLDYYRIATIASELGEEFKKAQRLCGEAQRFIESYPQFRSPMRVGEFALRRLECALHLGDYKDADAAAKECRTLNPKGATNWFFYMEYDFQLRMHLQDFSQAAKAYKTVTKDPHFDLLPESRRQRWELFEFYLEYVEGKFSDREVGNRRLAALNRFRLASTAYTKDKAGFNLSILLIEFLILLESKQYGLVSEKADAFRVYRQRYLKAATASGAFLQFLTVIAKKTERPDAIRIWVEKEGKAVRRQMNAPTNNLEGIQILPYSWLYEQILCSVGVG